jgi:hypothetical protein
MLEDLIVRNPEYIMILAGVSLVAFCASLLFLASSVSSYFSLEKGKRRMGFKFAISLLLSILSLGALIISADAKMRVNKIGNDGSGVKQVAPEITNNQGR